MTARHAAVALLVASALPLAGCSVGRFLAGAPAPGTTQPAQALLLRRCSGCHEVPDPAGMSPREWQAGLELMKRRMRLPQADWDSLAAMRPEPAGR